jgi:hypothetical protein
MDPDEEKRKFKRMLIIGIVFLMSAYFSWRELRYLAFGSTTDAKVIRVSEFIEHQSRGRDEKKLAIEYEFPDKDGAVRREKDHVSPEDAPPPAPTVQVQYISGSKLSRLPVNSQRWWLVVFFGSLGLAGFYVWRVVREGRA